MTELKQLFFEASKRWWVFAVVAGLTFLSVQGLQSIGKIMQRQIGFLPFDLQTPLRLEQMHQQLPAYTTAARQTYVWFIAVDTVFPLFACVLVSLVLALALRVFWQLRQQPIRFGWLVLLPLIGVPLDWLENVFFALSIWSMQAQPIWADLAVMVKTIKVAVSLIAISGSVMVFAIGVGVASLITKFRASRQLPS